MKILFISMGYSVHAAHWISQLAHTDWDVNLFPVDKGATLHDDLHDITVHGLGLWRPTHVQGTVRVGGLWPFKRGAFRAEQWAARLMPQWNERAWQLARTIRIIKPDVIHSLEMQHAAYLTLQARDLLGGRFPPWIYSSWGSDIYYFGRQEEHHERIRTVLAACDYHISDCVRDVQLARDYGFKGEMLGIFPGPGGFPLQAMRRHVKENPSARRLIVVKGQDHWAGRALIALEAIHRCAEVLRPYEICVYYTSPTVAAVAHHIQHITGLQFRILQGPRPHAEILELMGQARVALALAITDGVPNSMLEAMALGAFPIQSDTGAIAEWVEDGVNGIMVPPEDAAAVESALRRAVGDDALVEKAAEKNRVITDDRLDVSVVRPQVLEMYRRVFS